MDIVKPSEEYGNSTENVRAVLMRSALASMTLILLLSSSFANMIVIVAFLKFKKLRTNFNFYLLNLSISDLFLAFFSMTNFFFFTLYGDYPFGLTSCTLWLYSDWLFGSATGNIMMLVSVDRLVSIYHPITYRNWQARRYSWWVMLIMWVLLNAVILPSLLLVGTRMPALAETGHASLCVIEYSVHKGWITAAVLITFWLPEAVTVTSYILIAWKMRSKQQRMEKLQHARPLSVVVISKEKGINASTEVITESSRLTAAIIQPAHLHERSISTSYEANGSCVSNSALDKQKSRELKERKTFRLLSSLVLAVLICCVPADVYHFLAAARPNLATHGFYQIASFLAYVHCILNPILYHAGLDDMKKAIHRLFVECCTRKSILTSSSINSSPVNSGHAQ